MKNLLLSIFAASGLLMVVPTTSAQGFYPDKSYIEFTAKNFWVRTVTGTITGWKGSVQFNPSEPNKAQFDVRAKVKTIESGIEERDDHLRSSDFFHVEVYPEMRFESKRVEQKNEGFVAHGKLTIKDVTREVSLPFTADGNKLEGKLSIKRRDYNVGLDQSNFSVGNDIEVRIVCVLK
ncbi:MAG: polyisoprenoid-binding protein [Cryomorphaceae bacterium]|nr:MAG: polyisoprenoid-binding protein [Cryomorphaceae bacterium]